MLAAVERTQIYLTEKEARVLDRLAKARGTSRSHLIRDAIEAQYISREDELATTRAALAATFGLWKDRTDIPPGDIYVERVRSRAGMRYDEPMGTPEDPYPADWSAEDYRRSEGDEAP